MALPPAIQQFGIQATEFLAGIDEMLERTDQLAGSLDAAAASAERLSGVFDAAADADERLAAVEEAVNEQTELLTGRMDEMIGLMDEAAAASIRAADALDIMADSADRAGDSAVIAGDKAESSGDKAAAFGGMWKTALLGVGLAAVYGIDKAAGFQSQMEQLHTQAGVAQGKIAGLSQEVLQLSGQVGEGPSSLAESLYHVASNMASLGASGPQMMSAVKTAAEGAQVGGANLVDVTNALTAAIASGIPGVQNYQQAMGILNATVGSGDMHMQDLADAFSSGLLATVKGYGLSLKDVGAALATFGDNNIRGAKAGTDLRMAVQAMAVPMSTAGAQLQALGMNGTTLAKDMQSGGLMKALTDLTTRFKENGVTAKTQGEVITTLFGKKAGSGIAVLLGQMDRLKSKYPDISKSADNFAGDWASRQKTMSQQWDNLKSGAQSLAISFGTVLLPFATKVVGKLAEFGVFLEKHPVVAAFAGAMLALAAGFKIAATMESIFDAATDANPIMLVIMAVIALAAGLYELYKHSKLVRDIVADVGHFFKSVWTDAMHVAGAVVQWFVNGPLAFIKSEIKVFSDWWKQNGAEVKEVASTVWHFIATIISTYWKLVWDGEIKPGLAALESVWKTVWGLISDTVKVVWDTMAAIIRTYIRITLDIISVALDLLTGHWSKAWSDIKKLVSDGIHGIQNIITTFASGALHLLFDAGKNIVDGLINGVKSMFGAAGSVMSDLGGAVLGPFKSVLHIFSPSGVFAEHGQNIVAGLVQGISGSTPRVLEAMTVMAERLKDAGASAVAGLVAGMRSMETELTAVVERLGDLAQAAIKDRLQIRSPSQVFYELGSQITAGLASGIAGTSAQAQAEASKLANAVWAAYDSGQITQSEADSLLSSISSKVTSDSDTLIKTMQKLGLEMSAGLLSSIEGATSASTAKTAVNKLISYVQQAWSAGDITAGRASSLTSWLEADNTRLQNLAAQRQTIAATIKTADTYAATTTTNTESWAGLSNVASSLTSGGSAVYSGNILAGMQANLASIKAFNTALTKLAKLGLRKDLIDQIIQMGPDQGLQVAQALISGPLSVISSMNTTQAQILSGSTALGQAAANAMYDSGADAGRGFLSGLQGQQAAITKMMDQIAQSMITTVKRSLKISSPSQVFAEHGRMVALGLQVGMQDGAAGVRGAAKMLAAATAMPAGSGTGSTAAGEAAAPVIHVNVTVNGFVGSNQELAQEIYQVMQTESLRHAKRNGLSNGLNL